MIAALASDSPRLNVLFQTYIASQRIGALLDRHLEAAGITSNYFGLLSALGIWGPITPTEFAARIGLPPTTPTRRVALARVRPPRREARRASRRGRAPGS